MHPLFYSLFTLGPFSELPRQAPRQPRADESPPPFPELETKTTSLPPFSHAFFLRLRVASSFSTSAGTNEYLEQHSRTTALDTEHAEAEQGKARPGQASTMGGTTDSTQAGQRQPAALTLLLPLLPFLSVPELVLAMLAPPRPPAPCFLPRACFERGENEMHRGWVLNAQVPRTGYRWPLAQRFISFPTVQAHTGLLMYVFEDRIGDNITRHTADYKPKPRGWPRAHWWNQAGVNRRRSRATGGNRGQDLDGPEA